MSFGAENVFCTYELSDGVSAHGGVADPVLPDRTLCMVPADGERVGGGVEHAHVSGASARHCGTNTSVTSQS